MSVVSQMRQRIIPAASAVVWERLVRIQDWPSWHPPYAEMSVEGDVAVGTRFRYSNNGTRIRAEVTELVPLTRFEFVGRAKGVTARNRWRLIARDSSTTEVVVDEEMNGLLPWILRGPFNRGLGEGLEEWLASLDRSFLPSARHGGTGAAVR